MTRSFRISDFWWRPKGSSEDFRNASGSLVEGTLTVADEMHPATASLSFEGRALYRELHGLWADNSEIEVKMGLEGPESDQTMESLPMVESIGSSTHLRLSGHTELSREWAGL